jgi:hypothetical protein
MCRHGLRMVGPAVIGCLPAIPPRLLPGVVPTVFMPRIPSLRALFPPGLRLEGRLFLALLLAPCTGLKDAGRSRFGPGRRGRTPVNRRPLQFRGRKDVELGLLGDLFPRRLDRRREGDLRCCGDFCLNGGSGGGGKRDRRCDGFNPKDGCRGFNRSGGRRGHGCRGIAKWISVLALGDYDFDRCWLVFAGGGGRGRCRGGGALAAGEAGAPGGAKGPELRRALGGLGRACCLGGRRIGGRAGRFWICHGICF